IDRDRISVVGDTKYDRVLERSDQVEKSGCKERINLLRNQRRTIILGSCYEPDISLFLNARAADPRLSEDWFTILATHDTSDSTIAHTKSLLEHAGMTPQLLSEGD